MIRTSAVTTGTTPVLLVDCSNVSVGNPKTVVVQNNDATIVQYVGGITRGGPGVDRIGGAAYTLSTANGIKLAAAGGSITLTLGPGDTLYGLATSGTPVLNVLETGTN